MERKAVQKYLGNKSDYEKEYNYLLTPLETMCIKVNVIPKTHSIKKLLSYWDCIFNNKTKKKYSIT